nr:unnamed protein product [Callosobruchus analis]
MFQNFCRMSSEDFKILLELVEPYKKKRKTCCNASSVRCTAFHSIISNKLPFARSHNPYSLDEY